MKNFLFITALVTAAGNLHGQSINDELEIQKFVRNFMAAYNKQDSAPLRKMYSEYAVRTDANGKKWRGANEIIAFFEKQFRDNNATLLLRQLKINWSDKEHAYIASGTYEIYGKSNIYDILVHTTGTYANVMIKHNGKWQIAKSSLSPLVKVMVYQEVEDLAKWKSMFSEARPFGLAAGQLSEEFGMLNGQTNMAYMVSEWDSVEHFQLFMDDPNFKKAMQKAGMTEQPTVLILEQEK